MKRNALFPSISSAPNGAIVSTGGFNTFLWRACKVLNEDLSITTCRSEWEKPDTSHDTRSSVFQFDRMAWLFYAWCVTKDNASWRWEQAVSVVFVPSLAVVSLPVPIYSVVRCVFYRCTVAAMEFFFMASPECQEVCRDPCKTQEMRRPGFPRLSFRVQIVNDLIDEMPDSEAGELEVFHTYRSQIRFVLVWTILNYLYGGSWGRKLRRSWSYRTWQWILTFCWKARLVCCFRGSDIRLDHL